ncbi:MAG: hypothetical protein ACKPGB_08465, partial [Dolichospermum sp.]
CEHNAISTPCVKWLYQVSNARYRHFSTLRSKYTRIRKNFIVKITLNNGRKIKIYSFSAIRTRFINLNPDLYKKSGVLSFIF